MSLIFRQLRKRPALFIAVSVAYISLAAMNIAMAYFLGRMVDCAAGGSWSAASKYLIIYGGILALSLATTYFGNRGGLRLGARAAKDVKDELAESLLNADMAEITKLRAGDAMTVMNADVKIVGDFISENMTWLAYQALMAVVAIGYVFYINPLLGLVTFAYTPIGMFTTLTINKRLNALYPVAAEQRASALSLTEQAISCIPIIKTFAAERRFDKMIRARYEAARVTDDAINRPNALLQSACHLTSWLPKALLLAAGGALAANGKLSIGAVAAALSVIDYAVGPTVYFPFMLNSLNKARASAARTQRLIALVSRESGVAREDADEPFVDIRDLSYSYDDKLAISHFSYSRRGCGLVLARGKSGCGKSTLLSLMGGVLSGFSGDIKISRKTLLLDQDSTIFSMSLIDNIKIANPSADEKLVEQALIICGIYSIADNFPEKLDVTLGDGGAQLSGGERQRVAMARAVISDADILLMDEITSALDAESEANMLEIVRLLAQTRLVIAVAHRDSWADYADDIIDMDKPI